MVIYRILLVVMLMASSHCSWADDVRVAVQLDEKKIMPNVPIRGTLTIQHDKDQKVDTGSAARDGKPLKIDLVREVEIAPDSPLLISIYQFEIPPMPGGLQVLSPISVKVGGLVYKTSAVAYEVPTTSRMNDGKGGVILNLEAYANAPPLIFPGQKITVGYRFFYNENIDLTVQELPLLEAQGFKKVGSIKISDVNQGGLSVRTMEQEVEALKPGKFTFGPSRIVGSIYRKDNYGRSQRIGKEISAEAETVEITVSDFPEKDKPASFNGSVGEDIEFSVELLSYNEMQVGDKISLALKFSGEGDLSTINIPKICCEPGFPGFFEPSDIPPIPTPGNGYVIYYVEIRPLSAKISEIPAIEFSYYNPQKGRYEIRQSKSIPIKVNPAPEKTLPIAPEMPEKSAEKTVKEAESKDVNWPKTTSVPGAIEIETIYPLKVSDLNNRNFGTWEVLLVIPLGLVALYIQWDFIQRRKKRLVEVPVKTAIDYFNEAKEKQGPFSEFYALLTKALLMRLHEMRLTEKEIQVPEMLPSEGVCGQVREFLLAIEKDRFTGKEEYSKEEIVKRAEKLFELIG